MCEEVILYSNAFYVLRSRIKSIYLIQISLGCEIKLINESYENESKVSVQLDPSLQRFSMNSIQILNMQAYACIPNVQIKISKNVNLTLVMVFMRYI